MLVLHVKPGEFAKEFARAQTGYILNLAQYGAAPGLEIEVNPHGFLLKKRRKGGQFSFFPLEGEEQVVRCPGGMRLCEMGMVHDDDAGHGFRDLWFTSFDGQRRRLGTFERSPLWDESCFPASDGVYFSDRDSRLFKLAPDEVLTSLGLVDSWSSYGSGAYFRRGKEFFYHTPENTIHTLGIHRCTSYHSSPYGFYLEWDDDTMVHVSATGKATAFRKQGRFIEGSPFGAYFRVNDESPGREANVIHIWFDGRESQIGFDTKTSENYPCPHGWIAETKTGLRLYVVKA